MSESTSPSDNRVNNDALRRLDFNQLATVAFDSAVSVINSDYRYQYVNADFLSLTGTTALELVNRSVGDVWGQEIFTSKLKRYLDQALAGSEVHYQTDFPVPGCGVSKYRVSIFPFPDYDGSINNILVKTRNVSKRSSIEERIEFYEWIFRNNRDMIVETDASGTITRVNPAFETLTGYDSDDIVGMHTRILNSGFYSDVHFKEMWTTINSGEEWKGLFKNKRKDGSYFWEDCVIKPYQDEVGRIKSIVKYSRERNPSISEARAIIEGETISLNPEDSNTLDLVTLLLRSVVHEVKNPLGIAALGVEYLESKHASDDADYVLTFQRINRALTKAEQIMDGITSLSGPLGSSMERFNLSQRVTNCIELVKGHLETHNIVLSQSMDDSLQAYGNLRSFDIAIINLLINAQQASPSGGRIRISLSHHRDSLPFDNTRFRNRKWARLAIEDSGIGIPAESLKKVLTAYYSSKTDEKNNGLGLTLVKSAVESMGGNFFMESEEGEGSAAIMYLPITE